MLYFIVKSNEATESHPTELVVVYVNIPLAEYVALFHLYASQVSIVVVEVVPFFTVKFKVAVESHPAELVVE